MFTYHSAYGNADEIHSDQMPHTEKWESSYQIGLFHTAYIQYLKHNILTTYTCILCPPHISQYLPFQGRGILAFLHNSCCFLYPALSFQIWLQDHLRFDPASLCLRGEKYRIVCKTFRINRNGVARKAKM